jgi:hypothetical protein
MAMFINLVWAVLNLALACPTGYIEVPHLPMYSKVNFCVAKYEMRKVKGLAISQPKGELWERVTQNEAIKACRSLGPGYDLISNWQWQNIARNIAYNPLNWSSLNVFKGELSRGHSDNLPPVGLEADRDENSCFQTNNFCNAYFFSDQRRTHQLSNHEIIWDFAGNLCEWTLSINTKIRLKNKFISEYNNSQLTYMYSIEEKCEKPNEPPYCGYGFGWQDYKLGGAIGRSGCYMKNYLSGVFAAGHDYGSDVKFRKGVGFRCVYQAENEL